MTFSEVLSSVYEDCNYASSPAAPIVTRIKKYVNDAVRSVVAEPGMARILDSDAPQTFASVASQARYVLPESVAEIRHVTDRDNDLALKVMDLATYRAIEPDPASTTGVPTHIVPFGRTAVAVQPSDASELFVDSTSASDTNTAYLEGLITSGYMRKVSVSMTGTTAVSFSSAITSWIEVTDFYLSAAAVGTVTLHEDASGGTELARITIGALRPRYLGFYLWPTPAAAVTYYVDYRRTLEPLVQDADEPPGPVECHPYYSAYARMREYEKTGDDRFQAAALECKKWLSKFKYAVLENPDHLPAARWMPGWGVRRASRLGGWFPTDTW